MALWIKRWPGPSWSPINAYINSCPFMIVHEVLHKLSCFALIYDNSCTRTVHFYPFVSVFFTNFFISVFVLSLAGFRLFSPDTVPTLPAVLPGLHASDLSGWPTSWYACGGKRHCGGFWECQPRHVCNHRQVRVIIHGCRTQKIVNENNFHSKY